MSGALLVPLDYVEAAFGGDLHGVDQVGLLDSHWFRTPPDGIADKVRIVLGQLSQVDKPDTRRAARCDLGREAAKFSGQCDVGLDDFVLLRRKSGHVDGVDGNTALQVLGELFSDPNTDDLLASSVEPAMCGVASTTSEVNRGKSAGGGSVSNTSSAAPATLPESMASLRAVPLINSPRAQFTMRTPSFILAKAAEESIPRVSGVNAM